MKLSPSCVGCSVLRALLAVAMLGAAGPAASAANYELLRPIPEVRLKDDTVLRAVTFVSVGTASITGKWDGGRGSIPLTLLPDDMRAALVPAAKPPATPTTPVAANPPATSPAPPAASSGAAAATPIQATPPPSVHLSKLPTEIKLTQYEVTQSMGPPDGVKSDPEAPNYSYWLFRGKGRDTNGVPCDRIVGFDKGIVDGWKDGTFP